VADLQTHQFPFSSPIDLESLIYVQRSIGGGNFLDEKITPQMILNEVAGGGGLTPEVITADQTAVSGKLYIAQGSVLLTIPSALIPGITRFAITNPSTQNFSIHPNTGQTVRLGSAIADETKIISSLDGLAYCELIAVSTTSMVVTSSIQVGVSNYTPSGSDFPIEDLMASADNTPFIGRIPTNAVSAWEKLTSTTANGAIISNQVIENTGNVLQAIRNLGTSSYTISIDFSTGTASNSGYIGVIARAGLGNSNEGIVINLRNNQYVVFNAPSYSVIDSGSFPLAAGLHSLSCLVSPTTIDLIVDGNSAFSIFNSTYDSNLFAGFSEKGNASFFVSRFKAS
jgi:hypothetical protein